MALCFGGVAIAAAVALVTAPLSPRLAVAQPGTDLKPILVGVSSGSWDGTASIRHETVR